MAYYWLKYQLLPRFRSTTRYKIDNVLHRSYHCYIKELNLDSNEGMGRKKSVLSFFMIEWREMHDNKQTKRETDRETERERERERKTRTECLKERERARQSERRRETLRETQNEIEFKYKHHSKQKHTTRRMPLFPMMCMNIQSKNGITPLNMAFKNFHRMASALCSITPLINCKNSSSF